MTSVCGSGKDVKAEAQLANPSEPLVVGRFEDSRFHSIEGYMPMDIVKDYFFIEFRHDSILANLSTDRFYLMDFPDLGRSISFL